MKISPLADVKTHFSRFLDECQEEPIVVTRNGRPAAVLVPVREGDDLETLVLSHSPRFRDLLEAADRRALQGVPYEIFWARLSNGSRLGGRRLRGKKASGQAEAGKRRLR